MENFLVILILLGLFSQLLATSLRKPPHGRIVGGVNVTIEEYPYQVSILVNDTHNCGGAIVDEFYILTAAHCLIRYKTETLSVRAGSSKFNRGGIIRKVVEVFIHPDYNTHNQDYDIGLIKLNQSLSFNRKIAPATLPEQNNHNNSVDNMVGEATGWGRLYQNGPPPQQLQMVELPTLTQDICELVYTTAKITDRMFCAGIYEGGKDTCQGDSGGPFAVNGKLVGITSWGDGCGDINSPGVYTRVSYLVDYINSITSK